NFPFKVLLPESELKVVVDSRWFKQVLINLIETAIAQMEEGGIYISTQASSQDKFVYVWLDVPKQTVLQSEPIDLISSTNKLAEPEEDNIAFDPGMKFLLNQTLLEVMGGKLEIVPPLTTEQAEEMTRLQVAIPRK
ncbi:sensor histidine kinase, partial [Fischerella thermalis WC559]